jgi:hypothetical protein
MQRIEFRFQEQTRVHLTQMNLPAVPRQGELVRIEEDGQVFQVDRVIHHPYDGAKIDVEVQVSKATEEDSAKVVSRAWTNIPSIGRA